MTPVERVASGVACPHWCALPPGHDYEDDGFGDGLTRGHERMAASLGSVSIELVQHEAAAGPAGPIDRHPPSVLLHHLQSGGQVDLVAPSPGYLRAFAAALVDLAEQVEYLAAL